MSTKPSSARTRPVLAAVLILAGCASPPDGPRVTHFSQISFAASNTSALPDPAAATVLPVSLGRAEAGVSAYLGRSGFALEVRAEGGGERLTATRMGPPGALDGEAVCALEALRRPTISSTQLTVQLSPTRGGVRLETTARFVQIDTKIISGDLARQTCRSRGVLEAAVHGAALTGG